ncbi:MAG: hypothetical protein R2784_20445 [Saprospiraceae bacterium]
MHPQEFGGSSVSNFHWSIFTSTAYNHARYTEGTVAVNAENVDISNKVGENIPQWISRNGLNASYKSLSATLQLSYVADSYSDALNTESSQME